jgi:hypothetical protein
MNGCHVHVQDFPLAVYEGVQSCGLRLSLGGRCKKNGIVGDGIPSIFF